MNALIGARMNATGLMSPSPNKRVEAWEQMQSISRAGLLGQAKQLGGAPQDARIKETEVVEEGEVRPENELDREAFLELLVTQLQNQDPMDPMDNRDMVAQLAQFSSLEQMSNLNESFGEFRETMEQSSFVGATSLLGRTVTGETEEGDAVTGEVTGIHTEDGAPHLTVAGHPLPVNNITEIQ
ncbi:MAG: flagellar hook assembly protein FlgD [Candidatus Hydrogenedentota bacterium]